MGTIDISIISILFSVGSLTNCPSRRQSHAPLQITGAFPRRLTEHLRLVALSPLSGSEFASPHLRISADLHELKLAAAASACSSIPLLYIQYVDVDVDADRYTHSSRARDEHYCN